MLGIRMGIWLSECGSFFFCFFGVLISMFCLGSPNMLNGEAVSFLLYRVECQG